jgi:uncharacterized protein
MKSSQDHHNFLVTEAAEGVIFTVHVQPKASRNEISGLSGSELKIRLTSPPVDGAANKLCREYLAKLLGVAKSAVYILAGEKSRHKVIAVDGITKESVLALLNKHTGSSP